MTDLINGKWDVADARTIACIEQVRTIVKQHLDCLIDSGAEPITIKAIARHFCEAVGWASEWAILSLNEQLKAKAEENNETK